MTRDRSHAIVLGASMAGLLAARVLSDHYGRVTIVERDALPADPATRKGVPQGSHAHGLLASGYRVLDAYFPGMMDELEAAGAPRADVVGDCLWFQYGGYKLRHHSSLGGMAVSRPALEAAVRARVRALDRVSVLDGHAVERPVCEGGRVGGVVVTDVRSRDMRTLAADLVVDATGRGSQSPKWLEQWGFGRPATETVRVDVGYATRILERRPGDLKGALCAIIASTPPAGSRYAAALAAEGDRWVVTLAGMLGDCPPTDEDGWLEWARSLPTTDVYELARTRPALGPIASYRFPANQRRRYERMKRFPAGYLVTGDAVCSFNPIYGQGMSTAAMEARALDECLAEGGDGLARRYFGRAAKIADIPWLIATGEDLRYPEVEGRRPPWTALVNRYLERVHRVATFDADVCRRFFDVANLLAPPASLLAPGTARRVLLARPPQPAGTGGLTVSVEGAS